MYAVAGRWSLDPSRAEEQQRALEGIVDGVKRSPGFVRGFWSQDADDPGVHLTYIVFETLQDARAFRSAVEANASAQAESGVQRDELRLVEVIADA